MTEREYELFRSFFRHSLVEKPLALIRAKKAELLALGSMSDLQIRGLIDDLSLMEHYRTKSTSVNEEFERITEGFYR